jgi:tRNA (cmo5U34)-methyltransferase
VEEGEGTLRCIIEAARRLREKDMMNDNATPHTAASYDGEIFRTIPFYRQFHAETIDLVRTVVPDATLWLDTGCGTGYLTEQALPLFPAVRFLLADPSPAMLDQARERLSPFPPDRFRFLGAMATEGLLDLVSESPQVITAIQSHHYGAEGARIQATEVCFRLLARGGIYVTFENIRADTPRGTTIGLDRWCRFQRESGRSPDAVEEHRSRFGRNYFPITIPEHLHLLRDTGFATVEIFWLSHMQAGFYAIK